MAGVDQQHLHRSLGLTQRVEHRSPTLIIHRVGWQLPGPAVVIFASLF
jgi:hypothetical protein